MLDEAKSKYENLEEKFQSQLTIFQKYDYHYTMILKAMLQRMGLQVTNLDGQKVLREFQRLKHKEEFAIQRMKTGYHDMAHLNKEKSNSPRQPGKAVIQPETGYVIRLVDRPFAKSVQDETREQKAESNLSKELTTQNTNLLLAQKMLKTGVNGPDQLEKPITLDKFHTL